MTNEELDEARVKEGWRIVQDRPPTHVIFFGEVAREVARLAREGWTPPEPVSDDVLAARALLKTQLSEVLHGEVDAGEFDHVPEVAAYLAGCTRGREEAKGLQPCPFCGNAGYSQKLAEYNSFMAGCSDVDCIAHTVAFDFVSEETAISAWNTRVITG